MPRSALLCPKTEILAATSNLGLESECSERKNRAAAKKNFATAPLLATTISTRNITDISQRLGSLHAVISDFSECFPFLPLRRWTKGYTIKQPNMDCQPTEITALMRHRAVFS